MVQVKTISRWPAAMVASLGLHLAALLLALFNVATHPAEPMIEVDVLPVQVDLPPPVPQAEVAKSEPAQRDAYLVPSQRRVPRSPQGARSRLSRPATSLGDTAESESVVQTPETSPGQVSGHAEATVVAQAGPSTGADSPPSSALTRRGDSPKTLPPAVGDGLLAINPNDVPYQPNIPQPLRKPGASFLSRLKFCVTKDGFVDTVSVVTSSEPALDKAILEKARLYRFHPYYDQGRPIPFCFYREYRLSIQE